MRSAHYGWVVCVLLLMSSVQAYTPEQIVDGLTSPVVSSISNTYLWVPWFDRDDSCTIDHLHSGSSCNSGQTIDFTHNCMVTDEFSQLGIIYAYDATSNFNQFVNTVEAIPSSYGIIPAWRVYRDGNQIEQCRSGVNGNCDTASDATARIIIALYAGSQTFSDVSYRDLADQLAAEHVRYETVHSCYSTVRGEVCYWLAAGAGAAYGGRTSTDFGYTGYYPDAIIAMQLACESTGNQTFCNIADQYQQQYLLAANWDGQSFSAPPGRSWRWSGTTAICTNTCGPVSWDSADAVRALAICGINDKTADMQLYCEQWFGDHMQNPTSTPLQFNPDGSVSAAPQSGYFAQGLAAQFYKGWKPELEQKALVSALGHYGGSTWDNQQCFGIYGKAFSLRVMMEDGQDLQFQAPVQPDPVQENVSQPNVTEYITQNVTENITENITRNVTENITENITRNVTENITENITQIEDALVISMDSFVEPELDQLSGGNQLFGGFDGPMQQDQQLQGHSYVSSYEKGDLKLIVADGIGTAGAAFVDDMDLIIMGFVVLLITGFAAKMKRLW